MIQTTELEQAYPALISYFQGPKDLSFLVVSPPEQITAQSLVFCSTAKQFTQATNSSAHGIVSTPDILKEQLGAQPKNKEASEHSESEHPEKVYFTSPNPYLAMAKCLQKFFPIDWLGGKAPSIHPSANIAETAKIGKNVHIGAFVTVNENSVIGDNCIIRENTLVDHFAEIGEGTHLHSHVMIGHHCKIGKNCSIQSFTTIGSEGFGYVADENRTHQPIPHQGNVIIEDCVEIGASCTIDRGTFGSTIIRTGCIIDNKAHIAHNCELGEKSVFAGGFMVAGSTKLGKNLTVGADTKMAGHLNIPDGTVFAAATIVLSPIRKAGAYGGHPIAPLDTYMKNYVSLKKIAEMRANISTLMHKVFPKDKD